MQIYQLRSTDRTRRKNSKNLKAKRLESCFARKEVNNNEYKMDLERVHNMYYIFHSALEKFKKIFTLGLCCQHGHMV